MKGARSLALAAPYQSTTSLWSTVTRTAAVVVASAARISTCAGGLEQAAQRGWLSRPDSRHLRPRSR
jgi:hypothetical protein